MEIRKADAADAPRVAPLFDRYRQFYRQRPDPEGCLAFLRARLEREESVVYLAENESGQVMGFTQLYRSFCSVAMQPLVYLYDLYVDPDYRGNGVGEALMNAARDYGQALGAARVTLETQRSNRRAQGLYEKLGYQRDDEFYTYHLEHSQGG